METTRWPRTVRAGDLEIEGRMIGAGFVKLSEEELEKRRKEGGLASNATGRATIAKIVESLGVSRTRRITGRTQYRGPNMVQVRGNRGSPFPE